MVPSVHVTDDNHVLKVHSSMERTSQDLKLEKLDAYPGKSATLILFSSFEEINMYFHFI